MDDAKLMISEGIFMEFLEQCRKKYIKETSLAKEVMATRNNHTGMGLRDGLSLTELRYDEIKFLIGSDTLLTPTKDSFTVSKKVNNEWVTIDDTANLNVPSYTGYIRYVTTSADSYNNKRVKTPMKFGEF